MVQSWCDCVVIRDLGFATIVSWRLRRTFAPMERFLTFLDAHGLLRPRTNEPLGPYHPDALWRDHRLVVELDQLRHPHHPSSLPSRPRQGPPTPRRRLPRLRITWRQLHHDGHTIATELRTLLTADPSPRRS
jgi:hypothetical protein